MKCAEIEALLCDYADGTLGAAEQARVEAHLADCPACSALLADSKAALAFLEQVPDVEPPPALITRILHETQVEQRQGGQVAASAGSAKGMTGWLGSWFGPLLAPRFAMGMAMTILSFSLIGRMAGIPQRPLTAADLAPSKIWATLDQRAHRAYDRVAKYVDNLRLVYEIQNRLNEWSNEEEAARAARERKNRQIEPAIPAVTPDAAKSREGQVK